jgi:4-amino-4-deoxy-L-arabinose transferase-like glycosyltransferase
MRSTWLAWGVLLVVHLATIGHVPAGLHYDEAFQALDALSIGNHGYWPVFLPLNSGREPLTAYAIAASLRLFGNSLWAVRFAVTLAWAGSLPALYWLVRELYPSDGRSFVVRWAIAAPLLMTSLWFGITAHYACRAAWFVLTMLLFLAASWRVWNRGQLAMAVLAGFFGGLCFYTYLPNRLLPVLMGVMLIAALASRRARFLARWRLLALVVLVALVVDLPLVTHFVRMPQDFFLRTSQVSALSVGNGSGELPWQSALWDNAQRVAGMFFLRGDANPRYNLPERPALTWWMLPLLLVGLVSLGARRGRLRRVFAFLWLAIMLVPAWLSQNAPHFVRTIGALPPLCLLLADGGHTLWQWVQPTRTEQVRGAQRLRSRPGPAMVAAALVIMVVAQGGASLYAFWQWARLPGLYYTFDEGILQIGQYVAHLPKEQRVYLTPIGDHPTLTYSLTTVPDPPTVHTFDGRHVLVFRPGEDLTYVVVTHEDWRFEDMASWLYQGQEPELERTFYDRAGEIYAKVFHVPATAQARTPQFPKSIAWQDSVRLKGYDLLPCCVYPAGDRVYAELWWTVGVEPPAQTWTVFTHLLAPDGRLVAQDDAEPGRGSYATDRWQPGDVIVDEYQLLIPEDSMPGQYTLEIGLYNWQTGQRLGLADDSADSVSLQQITVEQSP